MARLYSENALTVYMTRAHFDLCHYTRPHVVTTSAALWKTRLSHYSASGVSLGYLSTMTRTTYTLHSRDFTNAAWVKTNMTVARDAVGANGVVNSACTLTATAANATVLQTITLASGARVAGFFLRRVTGTGTVEITIDNGVTWVPVTLTGTLTQFETTQTILNATVGVRIVTSGDVVEVDFGMLQDAVFIGPPVETEGVTITLGRDQGWISASILKAEGTIIVDYQMVNETTNAEGGKRFLWGENDGGNDRFWCQSDYGLTGKARFQAGDGTTNRTTSPAGAQITAGLNKFAAAWDASERQCALNGTAETALNPGGWGGTPAGNLGIGNADFNSENLHAGIARFRIWDRKLTEAELEAETT